MQPVLCSAQLSFKADAVIFNHGIGEKFLASGFDDNVRAFRRHALEGHFYQLADTHVCDALEAERAERMLNGLSLRIENAGLESDVDFGFQR